MKRVFSRLALVAAIQAGLLLKQALAAQPSVHLPGQLPPITFVTQDFPPFNYLENGQIKGVMVELIDVVCAELQRRCEHQLLPWKRAQRRVKQGVVDGLYAIGWHQAREQWLVFTPPILTTEYGFFVHQDNPITVTAKADLRGYRVGVFGPSNTSNSLFAFRGDSEIFDIRMTPGDEAGFRQLPVKRVDAVYSNRAVGEAMIKRLGLKNIRYAGQHRPLDYYIGFSRRYADRAMVESFIAAYRRLLERGDIARVLQRYNLKPALIDESVSE